MSVNTNKLWELTRGHRRRYLIAVLALVVGSSFMYLVPLVAQVVMDGVLDPETKVDLPGATRRLLEVVGGRDALADRLWIPTLVIAGLALIAGAFTYLRARISAITSEEIVRDVRERLYDHLQHLPASYHDHAATGDLVQRCTSDVDTLRRFLANQVVEIGRAVLMLVLPLPILLWFDARMTLVSVSCVVPIVVFSFVYFTRIRGAFQELDESEGHLTTSLQENLTGIRVVRAFARQEFEAEKFAERNRIYRDLDMRLYRYVAVYWAASDLMCMVQSALVIGFGGYWLAIGTLSVGTFYLFLAVVNLFIWPIRMMGRILTEVGKASVALGRIVEVLSEPIETDVVPTLEEHTDVVPLSIHRSGPRGAIEFDHVSFAYTGDHRALEDVAFRAEPGETLALVGPSGSGKSSIVSLLLRFYDPQRGVIRLDGTDIGQLDRKVLRSQIAVVMQEPFLYSKTLSENIRVGRSGASHDEIVEAATTACVHGAISSFEDGYETLVGERGVTLSGGQRQRVALARALLHRPAVMVLDDAMSAVDTGTETMILDALGQRQGRHTTIVIAHRLSTLMHADRIVVIDQGRVVQNGTHAHLLEVEGFYRRLWEIQGVVAADWKGALPGVPEAG